MPERQRLTDEQRRTIGQNVRTLRAEHGWTQAHLQQLCGFGNCLTVGNVEAARYTPKPETLSRLCTAFGVRLDELTKESRSSKLICQHDQQEILLLREFRALSDDAKRDLVIALCDGVQARINWQIRQRRERMVFAP